MKINYIINFFQNEILYFINSKNKWNKIIK